ncbi:MAG TPA: 4Fe-4S binding protein [Sedimenticola sp.]|nr:4Fe-4S binding protein [Sedimenticola sp.]
MIPLQRRRALWQIAGFILFVVSPPLDLFRYDLTQGHFYFLTFHWTLGLDAFEQGLITPMEMAFNVIVRGFLPLAVVGGGLLWTAWRYGRLYCGWLCPHFSVVETVNNLMVRASGRPSIWEKNPLPEIQPDGSRQRPNRRYWPLTVLAALFFAFLWALSLLTYLLPPFEIYHNLLNASLTPNQARFLGVGTLLLFIEFMFARHLFCRFGCAVGLFQSLAWMANNRAMVVGFDKSRAKSCSDCNNACDNVCPMRLRPRTIKRAMFTCTECAQCITACEQVQARRDAGTLLTWVDGDRALPIVGGPAARSAAARPNPPQQPATRG